MSNIVIDGVNLDAYGLKLVSMYMPLPEAKTNYVEVPGTDGALDMSEYFGRVLYADRQGVQFVFNHMGDYGSWQKMIGEVGRLIHGNKCIVTLPQDQNEGKPLAYYKCRLVVDPQKTNEVYGVVTISGTAEPFRHVPRELSFVVTAEDMDGDEAVASKTQVIHLLREANVFVTTSAGMSLDINGTSYGAAPEGREIVFERGMNTITMSGVGEVTFRYEEAML